MTGAGAIQITDESFEAEVLRAEVPVLVDFWAPWCGPCRAIAPAVEQVATDYRGRVKVVKLNVDDSPDAPERYGIRSIPTLLLFAAGEPVGDLVGVVPRTEIDAFLKSRLPARG